MKEIGQVGIGKSGNANLCSPTPTPLAVSNFRGKKGAIKTVFTWNTDWPVAQVTQRKFYRKEAKVAKGNVTICR